MDYLLILISVLMFLYVLIIIRVNRKISFIKTHNKNLIKQNNEYKLLLENTKIELQKCIEDNTPIPTKPILKTTVCEKPIITSVGFFNDILVISGEKFNKIQNDITLTKNTGEQIVLNNITSPSTYRIELPNLENTEYNIQIKSINSIVNCFSISDSFKYLPDFPGPIINRIFILKLVSTVISYVTSEGLYFNADFTVEGYNFTPDTIIKATHISGYEFEVDPTIISKNVLAFNVNTIPRNNDIMKDSYMNDEYNFTLEIKSNNQHVSIKLNYNWGAIENSSIRFRVMGYKEYLERENPPEIIYFE
jgi:hypothetical protein